MAADALRATTVLILTLTLILTLALGRQEEGVGETWNRAVLFGVRGVPGFPHVFDLDLDLRSGVLFLTSSSEPLGEGDEVRNTGKTERSCPPQAGRGNGTP
jgi:hypothetical protein